jgi:hypothetical protein
MGVQPRLQLQYGGFILKKMQPTLIREKPISGVAKATEPIYTPGAVLPVRIAANANRLRLMGPLIVLNN